MIENLINYSTNLVGEGEAEYFAEMFETFNDEDRLAIAADVARFTDDEFDLMFCIEAEPVIPGWASDAFRRFHARWLADSRDG